jgi:hypothetical protein
MAIAGKSEFESLETPGEKQADTVLEQITNFLYLGSTSTPDKTATNDKSLCQEDHL